MNTTNEKTASWSAPYFSLTHLKGLKAGYQVTVTDRESYAECAIFFPGSGFNATISRHASVDDAKLHGAIRAREMGAIA